MTIDIKSFGKAKSNSLVIPPQKRFQNSGQSGEESFEKSPVLSPKIVALGDL